MASIWKYPPNLNILERNFLYFPQEKDMDVLVNPGGYMLELKGLARGERTLDKGEK